MSQHPIRDEPGGVRVYSNYQRYTKVRPEDRKYKVRKPDDPRAVRWYGDWLLPLELLPDEDRVMPVTKPDFPMRIRS